MPGSQLSSFRPCRPTRRRPHDGKHIRRQTRRQQPRHHGPEAEEASDNVAMATNPLAGYKNTCCNQQAVILGRYTASNLAGGFSMTDAVHSHTSHAYSIVAPIATLMIRIKSDECSITYRSRRLVVANKMTNLY